MTPQDWDRCVARSAIAETTANELADLIHEHVTEMLLGEEAHRPVPPAIIGKFALCTSAVDDAHTLNPEHLSKAELNNRYYYTFKESRNTAVHSPYSISVPMMRAIMKVIANPCFLGTFTIARQIIKNQAEATLCLYAHALRAYFAHAVGRGLHIDISPTQDANKLSSFHRMMIDVAWVHWYVGAAIKEHFAHMGVNIGEQDDICGPAGGDACGNDVAGQEGVERVAGGDEGTDGGDAASYDDAVEEAVKEGTNPMSASQRKKQRRREAKADKAARDAYFNKTIEEANKTT